MAFTDFTIPVSISSMKSLVAYNRDQISERLNGGLKIKDVFVELGEALQSNESTFTGSYEGFRRAVKIVGIQKKSASQIEVSKAKELLREQAEKAGDSNNSPTTEKPPQKKSFNTKGINENDLF